MYQLLTTRKQPSKISQSKSNQANRNASLLHPTTVVAPAVASLALNWPLHRHPYQLDYPLFQPLHQRLREQQCVAGHDKGLCLCVQAYKVSPRVEVGFSNNFVLLNSQLGTRSVSIDQDFKSLFW